MDVSRAFYSITSILKLLSLSLSLSLFFVRCLSLFRTHERTRNEISITCNIITRRDRSNIEIVDEKRARFVPTVVRSGRFADAFELIGERAIKFFNKSRAKFASNEFHWTHTRRLIPFLGISFSFSQSILRLPRVFLVLHPRANTFFSRLVLCLFRRFLFLILSLSLSVYLRSFFLFFFFCVSLCLPLFHNSFPSDPLLAPPFYVCYLSRVATIQQAKWVIGWFPICRLARPLRYFMRPRIISTVFTRWRYFPRGQSGSLTDLDNFLRDLRAATWSKEKERGELQ